LSLIRIPFIGKLTEPGEDESVIGMEFGPRAKLGKLKRCQMGCRIEDQLPQAREAFVL
jgi:hypothetical protein